MDRKGYIGHKINCLSHILRQDLSNHTASLELTAAQSFLLGYLMRHREQAIHQKDLERQFNFTHATASGILRRLESKGYVTFQPGETDRRCKRVVATEKAAACHAEIMRHLQEADSRVVAGMSEAEVAQFHSLLDRAIANMGPALHTGPHTGREEKNCDPKTC